MSGFFLCVGLIWSGLCGIFTLLDLRKKTLKIYELEEEAEITEYTFNLMIEKLEDKIERKNNEIIYLEKLNRQYTKEFIKEVLPDRIYETGNDGVNMSEMIVDYV